MHSFYIRGIYTVNERHEIREHSKRHPMNSNLVPQFQVVVCVSARVEQRPFRLPSKFSL
jgi:hypothetical protein